MAASGSKSKYIEILYFPQVYAFQLFRTETWANSVPCSQLLVHFLKHPEAMTTPSKQYWIPEQPFLDTDTHTKLPDCLSPTIFNSA